MNLLDLPNEVLQYICRLVILSNEACLEFQDSTNTVHLSWYDKQKPFLARDDTLPARQTPDSNIGYSGARQIIQTCRKLYHITIELICHEYRFSCSATYRTANEYIQKLSQSDIERIRKMAVLLPSEKLVHYRHEPAKFVDFFAFQMPRLQILDLWRPWFEKSQLARPIDPSLAYMFPREVDECASLIWLGQKLVTQHPKLSRLYWMKMTIGCGGRKRFCVRLTSHNVSPPKLFTEIHPGEDSKRFVRYPFEKGSQDDDAAQMFELDVAKLQNIDMAELLRNYDPRQYKLQRVS